MPTTKIDGDSLATTYFFRKPTTTTITTSGNTTYTASQVLGGVISRDPNGAQRTDTTPTAAQIVSEMSSKNSAVEANSSFRFVINNTGTLTNEKLTISAGTGVTLIGMPRIEIGRAVTIIVVATNVTASSEAVSLYVLTNTNVKDITTVATGAGTTTYSTTTLFDVDSDTETHTFSSVPSVSVGDTWMCEIDWHNYPTGRFRFMLVDSSTTDRYQGFLINGNTTNSYEIHHFSDHSTTEEDSYNTSTDPFDGIFYFIVEKTSSTTSTLKIQDSINSSSPWWSQVYTDHDSSKLADVDEIQIATISSGEANYTFQKIA